ncbi:MAG TPA: hypothetical protein VF813_12465, partial [Anaerolineaceae bacterium]
MKPILSDFIPAEPSRPGSVSPAGNTDDWGPRPGERFGPWLKAAWRLSVLPMLLFFLLPVLALFTRTDPARILASLGDPQVYLALRVSLETTLVSLVLVLLLGTPVAFLIGRYRFKLKNVIDTLIDMPTVLPPAVAGLALLMTFGRTAPLGNLLDSWGIHLAFTPAAVVMAQIFIA